MLPRISARWSWRGRASQTCVDASEGDAARTVANASASQSGYLQTSTDCHLESEVLDVATEIQSPRSLPRSSVRSAVVSNATTVTSRDTVGSVPSSHYSRWTAGSAQLPCIVSEEPQAVVISVRRAALANTAIMSAFAIGDMFHYFAVETVFIWQLAVLYAALFSLLLAVALSGHWTHDAFRPIAAINAFLHLSVGMTSLWWRVHAANEESSRNFGSVNVICVMQLVVILLYPPDLARNIGVFLASFVVFSLMVFWEKIPILIFGEGAACMVATGIVAISGITLHDDTSGEKQQVPKSIGNNCGISDLFSPIFSVESDVPSPGEFPNVTTRLDRLVRRLALTRDSIHRSCIDGGLRRILSKMFGVLLQELKDASSLNTLPTVEFAGASPMTVDYVTKMLNQACQPTDFSPPHCANDVPNAEETKRRRRKSFDAFLEEQKKSRRPSHKAVDDQDWHRSANARKGNDGSPLNNSCKSLSATCGGDVSLKQIPQASATFDHAISAMMASLTFCEYDDELPRPCLSADLQTMLAKHLGSWTFDIFKVSKLCESRPLIVTGEAALRPYSEKLGLDQAHVAAFLDMIEARYRSTNHYHNSMHATDVMNTVLYFLNLTASQLASLDDIERLSVLVAASAHDVGHSGQANRFHISAETPVALLFNDQSVLENMHCTLLFSVLHSESCNFLAPLPLSQRTSFRNFVVKQILDTDLGKHIEAVGRFRQEFLNKAVCEPPLQAISTQPVLTLNQRKELLSFTLKCADVSGSVKPFDLHAQWTMRINAEFFDQGDVEKQRGLPCSPFCDRQATDIAESQRGFFDFIVKPLYSAFDEYLASRRLRLEVMPELERNYNFWQRYDSAAFDNASPMANGNQLRWAFHSGITQAQVQDRDEKDYTPGAPHSKYLQAPTLLGASFPRLSSKSSNISCVHAVGKARLSCASAQ